MRIGVLSDTHDNIWKLERAIEALQPVEAVLHCGDLCAPFVVKQLGEGLPDSPVHIVWGNNDGDQHHLTEFAAKFDHVHLHGPTARLELGGWRVAVNHYPDLARDMALSGRYDLVCYGHDHTAHEERVADCLLLNPGEVMGMNGRSSLALVDTEAASVEFVELEAHEGR